MFKSILVLFLVAFSIYTFLPDVDYAPGAAEWLSQTPSEIPDEDNLFYVITGFTAAEDKNPYKEGKRMVDAANHALRLFVASGANLEKNSVPEFGAKWSNPDITATEDINVLCDPRFKECLDTWISQKDTIEKSAVDNILLLRRYKDLYGYKYYQNKLAVDFRSPIPDLTNLMDIHRLHGLKIVLRFLEGKHVEAIQRINMDIEFTRRLMTQADTMIVKMVALSMLKYDLYLYATLMNTRENVDYYLFNEIPMLTQEEQSFEKAVKYEFLMNAKLIDEINRYPQTYFGDFSFPDWLPFPLFRKNHSTNMVYNAFRHVLDESNQSANEYYISNVNNPGNNEDIRPDWLSYVYNPIGSILFSVSVPDFNKYITRMHDMDCLIILINLKRMIMIEKIGENDIENYLNTVSKEFSDPYTRKNINWDPINNTLWIQNPFDENITTRMTVPFRNENNH